MGGDLPPAKGKAPTFMVWAVKDPTSGNLDRIQIVKGWTKSGQSFEKIYDVVWAGDRKPDKWTGVVPPIGSTVDVENATYTNTIGAVELKTVWTDPEFDPSAARLLLRARARDPDAALDDDPGEEARHRAARRRRRHAPGARLELADLVHAERRGPQGSAKPGTTVADLTKQGAVALNDAQLKALIVREVVWLQNTVTGDKYMIIYGALGKGGDAKPLTPSEPGLRHAALPGQPGPVPGPVRRTGSGAAEPRPATRSTPAISARPGPTTSRNGKIVTDARRHADRDHRLQGRRQVHRRAQQRVRLRQLRDHPRGRGAGPDPVSRARPLAPAARPGRALAFRFETRSRRIMGAR